MIGGVRRIAVMGGGIAGLCAAAALGRAGFEVAVYEQAKERKEFLLRRFAGWHDPVERLIEATPPESVLRGDIYDLRKTRRAYTAARKNP